VRKGFPLKKRFVSINVDNGVVQDEFGSSWVKL